MKQHGIKGSSISEHTNIYPDSKFHRTKMGPNWGRQDPCGPHVGPMNFAICLCRKRKTTYVTRNIALTLYHLYINRHSCEFHYTSRYVRGLHNYIMIYQIYCNDATKFDRQKFNHCVVYTWLLKMGVNGLKYYWKTSMLPWFGVYLCYYIMTL